MKIKTKLLLSSSILICVSLILLSFIFYGYLKIISYDAADSIVFIKATDIANEIIDNKDENEDLNFEEFEYSHKMTKLFDNNYYIIITDSENKILEFSDSVKENFDKSNTFGRDFQNEIIFNYESETIGAIRFCGLKKNLKNKNHINIYTGISIQHIINILNKIKLFLFFIIPSVIFIALIINTLIIKNGFKRTTKKTLPQPRSFKRTGNY